MLTRRMFHRIFAAAGATSLFGQDWPQWRGPNRNGGAEASSGPQQWPEQLKRVWQIPAGEGHSSPVVSGARVYQFARQGEREVARALDLETGKEVWAHAYPAPYEMNPAARGHGKGPKSTPLVADGRLYTFGMTGVLSCLDVSYGKQIWKYDSAGQFRQTSPLYGVAMSPLLHGSDLIAHVGTDTDGALMAFDAQTGKVRWEWKGGGPGYGSPMIVKFGGNAQIVTFSADNLVGVNASDGRLLWQLPFTSPYSQNSVTPFVMGDVVIYSGLSNPITAIRISAAAPQKLWENRELGMYMSSPVLAANLLHGLSHRNKGQYFSLDPKTGKTVWTSDGRRGDNALFIARGDTVFALTTDSELHVMRAGAKGLEPLRKYTVADSPVWAHPVVLGKRVLVKDLDALALWTA